MEELDKMNELDELPVVPLEEMTKDELELYTREKFGKELDKRKSLDNLLKEIKKLEDELDNPESGKKEDQQVAADYLKHPENGTVWESTELLRKRGDMIPCDKNGNPV